MNDKKDYQKIMPEYSYVKLVKKNTIKIHKIKMKYMINL